MFLVPSFDTPVQMDPPGVSADDYGICGVIMVGERSAVYFPHKSGRLYWHWTSKYTIHLRDLWSWMCGK